MFHPISKNLKFCQKYFATSRILSSFLGGWKSDETLSLVHWNILQTFIIWFLFASFIQIRTKSNANYIFVSRSAYSFAWVIMRRHYFAVMPVIGSEDTDWHRNTELGFSRTMNRRQSFIYCHLLSYGRLYSPVQLAQSKS